MLRSYRALRFGGSVRDRPARRRVAPPFEGIPMSGRVLLLLILVSLAVSVGLWFVSDGRIWFLALPLVFGLPLLGRRRG